MPGGNSTSRPDNRKEKQATSRMKQRVALGTKILNEADKGNIDPDVAEREMKKLFKSEGHKKDLETWSNKSKKESDRKLGKKYMQDKSTPKGTGQGRAYNKGGMARATQGYMCGGMAHKKK